VASASDVPRLVSTINAAFEVETFLEGTRTDFERLTEQMQRGEILLAENDDGQLIGCIYTELRETGSRGYLGMLAVDPTQQRSGYGRAIMLAGEEHLRGKGCSAVDICVISWRTELPPIYRRFGYVETGVEEFHPVQRLKPGVCECHCIVMTKTL
jgi:predicted N-acetyltransferase YhbS